MNGFASNLSVRFLRFLRTGTSESSGYAKLRSFLMIDRGLLTLLKRDRILYKGHKAFLLLLAWEVDEVEYLCCSDA